MCVGHSVDVGEEHVIMNSKHKIDQYIKTRLEREQQIIGKHYLLIYLRLDSN